MERRTFIQSTVMGAVTIPAILVSAEPSQSKLPEVALIGDSVRLGYAPFVQETLKDKCTVFSPKENGEHTINLLKYIHLWVQHRASKVIHINAGMHDIKSLAYGQPAGNNLVPINQYKENVERILGFIQSYSKAKVIWATTTPVVDADAERDHAQWKDFSRYNKDVLLYNEAAKKICASRGIKINDLYVLIQNRGAQSLQKGDGVHYKEEGSKILAAQTVNAISEYL